MRPASGSTLPASPSLNFALEADNENLRIETTAIRLKVRLAGFFVRGRCGQEPGGDWWRSTGRPDAQLRMAEFIERCAEHDILCDSFHLPSGYTSIGVHVFSWNRSKFPDPAGLAQSYLAKGIRMCANVKPRLLRDHPLFAEAAASGLLIAAPKGKQSWLGEFEQGDKWSFLGAPPKQGARSLELAHIRTRDNKRRRGRIGLNPEAGRTALKFLNRAGVSMVAVKANEALG